MSRLKEREKCVINGCKEWEEKDLMLTISSGPSHECLYGKPSGTILFNIISISSLWNTQAHTHNPPVISVLDIGMTYNYCSSYLTSGSQLSFNARLADVWRTVRGRRTTFRLKQSRCNGGWEFSIDISIKRSSYQLDKVFYNMGGEMIVVQQVMWWR